MFLRNCRLQHCWQLPISWSFLLAQPTNTSAVPFTSSIHISWGCLLSEHRHCAAKISFFVSVGTCKMGCILEMWRHFWTIMIVIIQSFTVSFCPSLLAFSHSQLRLHSTAGQWRKYPEDYKDISKSLVLSPPLVYPLEIGPCDIYLFIISSHICIQYTCITLWGKLLHH